MELSSTVEPMIQTCIIISSRIAASLSIGYVRTFILSTVKQRHIDTLIPAKIDLLFLSKNTLIILRYSLSLSKILKKHKLELNSNKYCCYCLYLLYRARF